MTSAEVYGAFTCSIQNISSSSVTLQRAGDGGSPGEGPYKPLGCGAGLPPGPAGPAAGCPALHQVPSQRAALVPGGVWGGGDERREALRRLRLLQRLPRGPQVRELHPEAAAGAASGLQALPGRPRPPAARWYPGPRPPGGPTPLGPTPEAPPLQSGPALRGPAPLPSHPKPRPHHRALPHSPSHPEPRPHYRAPPHSPPTLSPASTTELRPTDRGPAPAPRRRRPPSRRALRRPPGEPEPLPPPHRGAFGRLPEPGLVQPQLPTPSSEFWKELQLALPRKVHYRPVEGDPQTQLQDDKDPMLILRGRVPEGRALDSEVDPDPEGDLGVRGPVFGEPSAPPHTSGVSLGEGRSSEVDVSDLGSRNYSARTDFYCLVSKDDM
ncbi:single Ig IL-1-related receptor isoform X6 [Trachypithecus francoisi]|nr:single Ig IL-1-related receptor isoform X6 [Trachypithecus francoisi]